MIDLSSVPMDALLEEIVRRRNKAAEKSEVTNWCDDCRHFIPWAGRGDCPDNYNPCARRHRMSFRMPEEWEGPHGQYGYYRRVCADRAEGD